MKLAFAVRPDWNVAIDAAREAADRARGKGHEVVEVSLESSSLAREVAGVDVAVVFGGDGTMLRAARALAPLGIPILGVNLGRLGFLAAGSVEELDGFLLAPFTVYWADGLIVATATGSTAYGMSVGGPLIIPTSRAIMMVPIAPHLSFPNAVVLDVDQTITLEVLDEPARLSLDGQEEHDLHVGDRVAVRRAQTVARFVRTSTMRPFLTLLRKKILKEEGGPA